MKNLTSEEQRRIWKPEEPPIRKILLWGLDSQKNPCLLILYGVHEVERELRSSHHSYYPEEYLLKPAVTYTHYAVFHGINGHLPSIPNTYFYKEKNLLCYTKGYKTAHRYWDYHEETGWQQYTEIDNKYIIKEFYELKKPVVLNYFEQKNYTDYAAYLKTNQIIFEDIQLIDRPNDLFGFEADSPHMELLINIFSSKRLYARRKYLSQWMKTQPSVEEYEQLFKTASIELACGIFQELTKEQNPILLETAKKIEDSNILWASQAYHDGLLRCITQYVSLFDEKLLWKQKEFIYQTLPEMDFHIKHLKFKGRKLKGKELEEYLARPNAYQDMLYAYVFGNQNLYQKGVYTDGRNVNNIAFKNTIQTAKAYRMADAIGKIAYYLDAPRTSCYFRGSGRTSAYNYYVRYLRRTLDEYQATDEVQFITAAREMLTSYTDHDNLYEDWAYNFFFQRYFGEVIANQEAAKRSIWHKYLADVVFVAQNAKAALVHEFCFIILNEAYAQHKFDSYDIKELIALSKIPNEKTANLFTTILLEKIKALQEFDAELMISLMSTPLEQIWDAAKTYFSQTSGSFLPEHVADFLFLDTIETWYDILEENINHFTIEEYAAFLKSVVEKRGRFVEQQIELCEPITNLLLKSVSKLDAATINERQELLRYFASLLLSFQEIPDFLFDMTEQVIFSTPYDILFETLQTMDLHHGRISEREYNTISLLKSCKASALPNDSLIVSILETGSKRLVRSLTELIDRQQTLLAERTSTLLLLFECNVSHLNKTAQSVLESLEIEKREKLHLTLLDSPMERTYQYGLRKLDEWYGGKIPTQFISHMMEHPCVEVKSYLSQKMEHAFSKIQETNPDLYIYYAKTILYLPNKVSKSKEQICRTIPLFLRYYPEKQQELEQMLLDIGSTNSKIDSERALVTFAQIQKEVSTL